MQFEIKLNWLQTGIDKINSGLASVNNSAKRLDTSLQSGQKSIKAFGAGLEVVGNQVAGNLTAPVMMAARTLGDLREAAQSAKIGFGPFSVIIAGITTTVVAGVQAFRAYSAKLEEIQTRVNVISQQGTLAARLREMIFRAQDAGKLSDEQGTAFFEKLESTNPNKIREVQKALREIFLPSDRTKASESLLKQLDDMRINALEGLEKDKAEAVRAKMERFKAIDEELAKFKSFTELKSAMIDAGRAHEIDGMKTVAEFRTKLQLQAESEFQRTMAEKDQAAKDEQAQRTEKANAELLKAEQDYIKSMLALQEKFQREQEEADRMFLQEEEERQRAFEKEKALREQQAAHEKAINNQRLDGTRNMFTDMAQAARVFGEKGFAAYKAFASAAALVDTYRAATAAFAAMASIPYVGPILGAAAAAAAVAAGMANIAVINSASYSAPSYAVGGYTGAGPVNEPAGTVHRGEWIVPAWQVSKIGLANLESTLSYLATANYSAPVPITSQSGSDAAAVRRGMAGDSGSSPSINVEPTPVNVAVLNNQSELVRFCESKMFEKIVITHINNNRGKVGIRT